MNIINELSTINEEAPCPQQRYTVFGKISAAILSDSSVTIAMAMLLLRASCPPPLKGPAKLFKITPGDIEQTDSLTDFINYLPIVCIPMKYPS